MTNQVKIGARLRAARQAKSLTLEDVAVATGMSQGFVSRLERDQVSPSVASLVTLCSVVGLKVGQLFETPQSQIVRAGKGSPINFGGEGAEEQLLTPGTQSHVEVIHSVIDPGGNAGDALYALDCEVEFVYVIRGTLRFTLGEQIEDLDAGDSMTFRGRDPHRWENASSTETCEVLWVMAPAP